MKLYRITPYILFLFSFLFSFSQNKIPVAIGEISKVKKGDKKIAGLAAPKGYQLKLTGSDGLSVIDTKGNITQPLVSTEINLYYVLSSIKDSTEKYDVNKLVTVPGRYDNDGSNIKPFVIPSLREWHGEAGDFKLNTSSKIIVDPKNREKLSKLAELLQKEIKDFCGLDLGIAYGRNEGSGNIYLSLGSEDKALGEEGYYSNIKDNFAIYALHYQGLFWGTRTLLQLLEQEPLQKKFPKGEIRDYPKYKVRGFVLDVGRKFFSLNFLNDYVKLMSYYKMNDFHVHLNDNGFKNYFDNDWDKTYSGFRLENTTYPNLATKNEFYSKKEFREFQKNAQQYAVRIIPEIDVPAHSLAITKAVPEIASAKYGRDHLDINLPKTYEVTENIFKEYLEGEDPVFVGKEVHIGTDEYNKAEAEAFRKFTDHFIGYVQGFGKNVRLWGALTHAKGKTLVRSKNVIMNTWYNGYADPIEMKKLGYQQISTPDGWLYIVPKAGYYYDYLDIENIYKKWEPRVIGNVTFPMGDPSIIGGSFAVWNDIVGNGITEKDVHERVFPALQVLAEKMWKGTTDSLNFKTFEQKAILINEGPFLNIRGKLNTNVMHFPFSVKREDVKLHNAQWMKTQTEEYLDFTGDNSYAEFSAPEAGYDYTVSFDIYPKLENNQKMPVFTSSNAMVYLQNGVLRFFRDGYDDAFHYSIPKDKWTRITITGTKEGVKLYVNGSMQQDLTHEWKVYNDKDKTKRRQMYTLFFPLQKMGGFQGKLKNIIINNRLLSDKEIKETSF
ncbi:family 20 glycosylhydrolase [Elizabethkingia miricola]|uniref:family 20 glycosylhydrolase n=1 Tax=Elizabethkingia miricola TaxID=172045 RepID=UPI0038926E98